MKPRYVDFLSDQEYKALHSYKADTRMLVTGMLCILTMLGLSLGVMIWQ